MHQSAQIPTEARHHRGLRRTCSRSSRRQGSARCSSDTQPTSDSSSWQESRGRFLTGDLRSGPRLSDEGGNGSGRSSWHRIGRCLQVPRAHAITGSPASSSPPYTDGASERVKKHRRARRCGLSSPAKPGPSRGYDPTVSSSAILPRQSPRTGSAAVHCQRRARTIRGKQMGLVSPLCSCDHQAVPMPASRCAARSEGSSHSPPSSYAARW
jgi:hypothetical protein